MAGMINQKQFEKEKGEAENTIIHILNLLIVALATKNVDRKNKPNTMAKQAIKPTAIKKDYEYTTTLTIGKVLGAEREGGGDTGGWKVRPHLRRGHIRDQKYGPRLEFTKQIFIQPVFVNAADNLVLHRKAYNVRKANVLGVNINVTH